MFHVLDAETGGGLAQTKIHFAYFGVGGEGEGGQVMTDNNGDAAIPKPDDPTKDGGPNVFVTAEGYVPKVVGFRDDTLPAEYTMKMDPAMTASGIVVDAQGVAVSGVEIKLHNPGNKSGQMENVDFQTCPVTNRDDGGWSCSYIPRDYTNEIRFILKKPGYAVTFPVVPVPRVNLTNLVLVIDRGFTVIGQINDPQSRPIAKARIKTVDLDRSKQRSTQSEENGVFTLTGVAGGLSGNLQTRAYYQAPPVETNASGGMIVRGLAASGTLHLELAIHADGFAP
jgi:hypothetical protein